MVNKKWILRSVLGLLLVGFSLSSFAGGPEVPMDNGAGFFAGGQIGYVASNWDYIDHNAFDCFNLKVDDANSFGARPYIGYSFGRHVAVEMGYTYLGDAKVSRLARLAIRDNHRRLTTIHDRANFDSTMSIPKQKQKYQSYPIQDEPEIGKIRLILYWTRLPVDICSFLDYAFIGAKRN